MSIPVWKLMFWLCLPLFGSPYEHLKSIIKRTSAEGCPDLAALPGTAVTGFLRRRLDAKGSQTKVYKD